MSVSLAPPAPSILWSPAPATFHIIVNLRDTETGETRVFQPDWDHDEDHDTVYQWTGGNYGCDCNRMAFLMDDSETDWPCSDGRVVVDLLYIRETGKVLMRDNEPVD